MYEVDDEIEKLEADIASLEEAAASVFGDDVLKTQQPRKHVVTADGTLLDQEGDDEEEEDVKVKKLDTELDELTKALDYYAKSSFESAAEQIAKSQEISGTDALRKARLADPQAYRQYQASGVSAGNFAKAAESRPARRQSRFMDLARHIQVTKNLSGGAALAEARKANPDLWKAYQASSDW
jgi:hypothetical protein